MGKSKGQSHNQMYITNKEYAASFGGKTGKEKKNPFQRLPFYCCALSLTPFEDPVCTEDGIVYDILNIVPFLRKHKRDPTTGKPLNAKDLIKLKFHKNVEGEYICPFKYSVFTEHSHIVAIKTSGNLYSYEAVEQMNIKNKNWKDLLDDTPFTRKDIIVIQDPNNLEKRNISTFDYVKEGLSHHEEESSEPTRNITMTEDSKKVFEEMKEKGLMSKPTKASSSSSTQSTHIPQSIQAPSFTSTGFTGVLTPIHPADSPGKETKKKGYVQMTTTCGDLNLEIHCDLVPKTSENFLELCEKGYYDGTIFHRSIKNFMVQGGDPTGSGKGGKSLWERTFKDEFKQNLLHDARGVLSMANSGPNTNNSQFFILFKSAPHLNFKHSVFGKVVGGMDTLRNIEVVPTDEKDRPTTEIKIIKTTVFMNPFRHLEEEQEKEKVKKEKQRRKQEDKYVEEDRGLWFTDPSPAPLDTSKSGVGKYIKDLPTLETNKIDSESNTTLDNSKNAKKRELDVSDLATNIQISKKPTATTKGFGNFDSW